MGRLAQPVPLRLSFPRVGSTSSDSIQFSTFHQRLGPDLSNPLWAPNRPFQTLWASLGFIEVMSKRVDFHRRLGPDLRKPRWAPNRPFQTLWASLEYIQVMSKRVDLRPAARPRFDPPFVVSRKGHSRRCLTLRFGRPGIPRFGPSRTQRGAGVRARSPGVGRDRLQAIWVG